MVFVRNCKPSYLPLKYKHLIKKKPPHEAYHIPQLHRSLAKGGFTLGSRSKGLGGPKHPFKWTLVPDSKLDGSLKIEFSNREEYFLKNGLLSFGGESMPHYTNDALDCTLV